MKVAVAAVLLASITFAANAKDAKRPKLIVQITLDQLRGDALQHYSGAFDGGLHRILSDGFWTPNGTVDHAITVSYPGHASLATGAYPSTHGMTANEWWMERDGRWTWVDAAADAGERVVGFADAPGPALEGLQFFGERIVGLEDRPGPSARNLLAPSLGEWVKAANPAAKAISLSTGNFIAIVYGGHKSDGVYWFDASSGSFVTSTYYRETTPDWVADFNRNALQPFKTAAWETVLDAKATKLANPDASPIENEGKNAVFPHRFADEHEKRADRTELEAYNSWFAGMPMKDGALVALAMRAVEAEHLGEDDVTDYLSIAFNSTDSIGHAFGWRSVEYLDALARIDRELGKLLGYLDEKVGKGGYVLALSADHGVADFPETTSHRRVTNAEIEAALDRVEILASTYEGPAADLPDLIARELEKSDFIAAAYTAADLTRVSEDPYAYLYRRSFRPDLTPDFPLWTEKESRPHHPARYGVVVRYIEGAIFDSAPAVHGSPYDYDRNVPVAFYGAGVKPKQSEASVATIDIAPTLAELAGLEPPPIADGTSAFDIVASQRRK